MLTPRVFFVLIFSSLLLGLAQPAVAQSYGNRHPFDFKRFNLGFLMGMTYNSYNLKEQINIEEDGIMLHRIELVPRYGLNLGMITNANLSRRLSLRFVPTISLEQRDFRYYFSDGPQMRKIEASYLNLPVMLQLKTDYYRRTRVYVLTGGQIGFNLASNKRVRDDLTLLKITNQDLSLTFGFGVTLYGDRIKLSPEILYTMGMVNIYEPLYTTHAEAISSLMSQVIAININFE